MVRSLLEKIPENYKLCLSIIIFLTIVYPIFYISLHSEEFKFLKVAGYAYFLFFYFIIFSIFIGFIIISFRKYSNYILYCLLTYTIISGLFLPVIQSNVQLDPSEYELNLTHFSIAILFAIITSTFINRIKRFYWIFIVLLLLINFIFSIISFINSFHFTGNEKIKNFLKISKNNNIFVLSIDAIPSELISKILSENPDLRIKFKDFEFFKNAISQAPHTRPSLRAELLGNQNYQIYGRTNKEINNNIDLSILPFNQVNNSYSYGMYNEYVKDIQKKVFPGELIKSQNISDHHYLFKSMMARIYTNYFSKLIDKLNFKLLAKIVFNDSMIDIENSHKGPAWSTPYIKEIYDLKFLIKNISSSEEELTYRQAHFLFSHSPISFDENCEYKGDSKDFLLKSESYDGNYALATCELNLMADLLDSFKKNNIYNNSLIILKSDHGAPSYYYNDYPGNIKFNGHYWAGYDRYRPLLMIKSSNSNQSKMKVNDEIVSLSFLGRTICNYIYKNDKKCEQIPGRNIQSDKSSNRNQNIFLEIVKNDKSTTKFEDHFVHEVKIESDEPLDLFKDIPNLDISYFNYDFHYKLTQKRLEDLDILKKALLAYKQKYSNFPKSKNWDGYKTPWGQSSEFWISGLIPEFIYTLPRDPLNSENEIQQYLYKSDGKDFKLIAHGLKEECKTIISKSRSRMVDPVRNCWAFGYWTENAKNW